MSIHKIRKICEKLGDMGKESFYTLSSHGYELEKDIIIPQGVRIIMFCYSGKILDICEKFDLFNWENIFLDEDSTYNYCTFLGTLVQYPSLRDHFCIYDTGMKIKEMEFIPDLYFRDGIYKLPIYGSGYDKDNSTLYLSDQKIFSQAMSKVKSKRVIVDKKQTAKILMEKNENGHIFSFHETFSGVYTLSRLIENLKLKERKFTLLLLTCRESTGYKDISVGKNVYSELEKLIRYY